MPLVKVWIHAVWSTKNREKFLTQKVRQKLFHHIFENGLAKDIYVVAVNGFDDHVHCLFQLKNNQSIGQIMNLLKGESSHWFNKNQLTEQWLYWQNGYYAVSIGESTVSTVKKYILNQEKHHTKNSFDSEIDTFFEKE